MDQRKKKVTPDSELIDKTIKEKFGTKVNYCALNGYESRDFTAKVYVRLYAVDLQNEFFLPMGLRWKLVEIEPKEI
jgi:hypothetical protein